MAEPLDALYTYAQEHMVLPILQQKQGYKCACHCAEQEEERLRAMLDEQASQQLEKLIKEQIHLTSFCEEAVFQSGFRLALDLMRL